MQNELISFLSRLSLLGHGVMSDAVRTRGSDPVQTGSREEGHHQGDMVGKITGNLITLGHLWSPTFCLVKVV